MTNARIHRFRDNVAVSFDGEGETIYMDASQAYRLAEQLINYAADCRNTKFTDSPLGNVTVKSNKASDDE